uniref:peroxidase n=1 Tax=Tanacetum cinerariifolium TaxID=118510 RepID=A0A6L2MPR2_TANCI|nr:basic peroxidase-like [Tanacetum cinerariifolium]
MGYHKSIQTILVPIVVLLVSMKYMPCKAQLCTTFYDDICPSALTTIRDSVSSAVSSNRRTAALLIRLHFHDCFVQGCDASILLDGTGSEKASPANDGVLGYEAIDDIKAAVESVCPGVVSCADILAVAARDASVAVGGPSWEVRLGRRDSQGSNASQAVTDLPRGSDNLTQLIASFNRKGLSVRDMVALSANLRSNCPQTAPNGDGNLEPLDLQTPNTFDNNYFRNLVVSRGLLTSDQVLFNGDSTDSIVIAL